MRRVHAASLAVVATILSGLPSAFGSDTAADSARCMLCSPDPAVPVVRLTTAWLDSVARAHASFNANQLARIDSLFRAGRFGPCDDRGAQGTAHLLARLRTINAYPDLVRLACDSTRVYEADEATLRELYARYSDVNLLIDVHLERARLGLGRVCMRYRLDEKGAGVSDHGGKQLRWRIRDVRIDERRRRVLDLIFPMGEDEVDLLIASHHSFAVEYRQRDGPPAPYEWFLVRDIEGIWVRKLGIHRPTAYMYWVSPAGHAAIMDLPSIPLAGVRIYFPGLKLRLPLLPDINVDDLREEALPMPILDLDYIRQHREPSWLDVDALLGFRDWRGHGALPAEIRREFPDR